MTDTTSAADESILGPITPIRCTEPGCHWAAHGVPDKYTASRAQILADHFTSEHTPRPVAEPAPATTLPAALGRVADLHQSYDGACGTCADEDGQAAVWPCETATALAVARQVLGTTTGQPETAPAVDRRARYAAAIRDTDGWVLDDGQHMIDAVMAVADGEQAGLRATVLNEAADAFRAMFGDVIVHGADGDWANVADWTATGARIPACGSFYPHHTDTRCVLHKGHRGSHRAPWGSRTMAWPYDRRETQPNSATTAGAQHLSRMAAEAQQPTPDETEEPVSPTAALLAARCDDCQHVLNNHLRYGACLHDGCTCRRYHPAP
ncbi:hypothetical protein ACWCQM_11150 [Streptomyces sp. NPDC002125]